jgi:hypothetical protein
MTGIKLGAIIPAKCKLCRDGQASETSLIDK